MAVTEGAGLKQVAGATGRLVGYARTSTPDQSLALQLDALHAAGIAPGDVHEDQASGATMMRPGLTAALARLRPGDTLVVWKLDRLGRSVADLATTVRDLTEHDIGFHSITEGLDTGTTAGRLLLYVLAAVAETERELTRERVAAGMAAAKRRGDLVGRRPALNRAQASHAAELRGQGRSLREIARLFKVSHEAVRAALARSPMAA